MKHVAGTRLRLLTLEALLRLLLVAGHATPLVVRFVALTVSRIARAPTARVADVVETRSTNWQLNEFVTWVNRYCTRTGRADTITHTDGGVFPLRSSQFRRTLAWFIARRPGGSIAGTIQYKHHGIQMFEGYAGTSRSGFRTEVDSEQALLRGEQLTDIATTYHHDLAGPAAEDARRRLTVLTTAPG